LGISNNFKITSLTSEWKFRCIKDDTHTLDFWYVFTFTFVTHPGVEPTNNRAERALREHVAQRKIVGTLRNRKGTSIHERIMTVLATWVQQGLNSFQMMRAKLSS